ncbi:PREDICTED: uncharacterized protein LOC108613838 [Drosophila arizonae]|uniref:Uncharacterized protein LOC108613838 n=1 Tax=Drosophila arizonae TaxID=7263 RepID=A0ABM1P7D0_DROAR|nr:PREDICTED: uncharacterized protein LOC108613838 [Drosophila arizonae]
MPQGLKLSEIKAKVNNVIDNLQLLEAASNASPNGFDLEQSRQLERQTTNLLAELSEIPCEKLARTQLQRKQRRQRTKKKLKRQIKLNRPISKSAKVTESLPTVNAADEENLKAPKQAEHITLKKHHDSSNILYTLDLLERLYKARGGKGNLSEKLVRMRTVWRRVQQESINAINQEMPTNCEAQWSKAIFGISSVLLKQGSLKSRRNIHNPQFVEWRAIWDSYISSGKVGSSIPHGWVLPGEKPSADWAKYLCE